MSFTLIGKHEKDSRNNRDGYVTAMLDLMEKDSKVMHVDCDLENCINTGKLAKAFPEQTVNAGIAEANAMGVAAGLAATGRTVFMHSFGCFASRRAFDQAFMSAAYAKLPVHVIGSDPGVCAAYNGGTHMPFEDCALYMSVPEAVVIDPVDFAQINCLTKKLAASGKFSYMRMIRKGFTTVYGDGSDFEIGKGVTLKEGKDVAIIASGIMVDEALKAQEQLAAEGISAKVIDMFTWKPLDEQLILDSAAECGAIVTAENHQVKVGLGSAVANVVIKNNPVPMEMVGVEDRFGQVGAESFLREEYGLTRSKIASKSVPTYVGTLFCRYIAQKQTQILHGLEIDNITQICYTVSTTIKGGVPHEKTVHGRTGTGSCGDFERVRTNGGRQHHAPCTGGVFGGAGRVDSSDRHEHDGK